MFRNRKRIPKSLWEKIEKYPRFYQKVWLGCLDIKKGQCRSYQWLARHIGHPGAWRAVGRALAKNPFAPVIPCHRVIRSDGKIGGYSGKGGRRRKIQLLRKESATARRHLI